LFLGLSLNALVYHDSENRNGNPDTDIIIPEIEVPDYYRTVRIDTDQVNCS
jgi:hypothetical protein